MSYQEIEHTGDVGLEVRGTSREELFEEAAKGLMSVIGLSEVKSEDTRSLRLDPMPDDLLFNEWLTALLDLVQYDEFAVAGTKVHRLDEEYGLEAEVQGESLDYDRHSPETEVKAVTYHNLSVIQENGEWIGRVIFDL